MVLNDIFCPPHSLEIELVFVEQPVRGQNRDVGAKVDDLFQRLEVGCQTIKAIGIMVFLWKVLLDLFGVPHLCSRMRRYFWQNVVSGEHQSIESYAQFVG